MPADPDDGLEIPAAYLPQVQQAQSYSDGNRRPCPRCGEPLTGREVRSGRCRQCGLDLDHAATGHADSLEAEG